MNRADLLAVALASVTVGCGVGAFKPWRTYAAVSARKPASPLRAPADRALVVTILHTPQGNGNGGYTVFDGRRDVIAQFGEPLYGWSMTALAPGVRRFYLRTWSSDHCIRLDAALAAGKVYLLSLSDDVKNARPDMATLGMGAVDFRVGAHLPRAELVVPVPGTPAPAGPLLFYPFIELDARRARAELDAHASQVASCMATADKAAHDGPRDVGFDEIDFTIHGAGK